MLTARPEQASGWVIQSTELCCVLSSEDVGIMDFAKKVQKPFAIFDERKFNFCYRDRGGTTRHQVEIRKKNERLWRRSPDSLWRGGFLVYIKAHGGDPYRNKKMSIECERFTCICDGCFGRNRLPSFQSSHSDSLNPDPCPLIQPHSLNRGIQGCFTLRRARLERFHALFPCLLRRLPGFRNLPVHNLGLRVHDFILPIEKGHAKYAQNRPNESQGHLPSFMRRHRFLMFGLLVAGPPLPRGEIMGIR